MYENNLKMNPEFFKSGMHALDSTTALVLLAFAYIVVSLFSMCTQTDTPAPPPIPNQPAAKLFHQWQEARGYFQAKGVQTLYLSTIEMNLKIIFQGNWNETEKAQLEDIIYQEDLWQRQVRAEIIDNLSALGLTVTQNPATASDCIASGHLVSGFVAKKFIFKYGSAVAELYLEIRSITSNEIIAIFIITENIEL